MSKDKTTAPPASAGGLAGGEPEPKNKRQYKPLPPINLAIDDVPKFEDYSKDHLPEIKQIQKILDTKLSDNSVTHDDQIREAEAHLGRMSSILAWADFYLDLAERRELVPRDPDYTDVDREIHLAAAVSLERRFRNVVKGLHKSAESRVSLGQSRMKSFQGERR